MKNQEYIAKKVQEALNSIDSIERAEVKPFFFTRLEAKLENEHQSRANHFSFLANMKLNLAMLAIVFLFNITSVVLIQRENSSDLTEKSSLEVFTEEYSSITDTYDNLNNR